MQLLNTIKSKFISNFIAAVGAILISVIVAYFIAMSSIKTIMTSDLNTVADALEKNVNYIAKIEPMGYQDEGFKKEIKSIKIGKSGYVYFINAEGVMTIHPKDEGQNKAGHDYIDHIRHDKAGGIYEYVSATTGQDKISAYRYIPAWDMWVIPGINKADYFDELKAGFIKWFLLLGTILTAMLVTINYITGNSILKPIEELDQVSSDLAHGNGDLTKRLPIMNQNDEIGIASRYLNSFIDKIQTTINDTKKITSSAVYSTASLRTAATSLSTQSEKTNMIARTTNTTAAEIGQTLESSVSMAKASLENSHSTEKELASVRQIANIITREIYDTTQMSNDLAERFAQLSSEAASVNGVLSIISDIADQTNLLALNAAIEAARAGEHGRGFAVVADEVRKLAERTQKSLTEINSIISVVIQSISDSSDMMSANGSNIERLAERSQEIDLKIDSASSALRANVSASQQNAEESEAMARKIKEIITKVSEMSELSQNNQNDIKQISQIATELYAAADSLNNQLAQFKS
ncbi:MAG: methyl-accepting chemotaxis protein [Sulfuricurvum sp.]|jgi:methyl-accepting chemotaxis protein|uniref:methyl-accepting chemotaxis protein n=1 Tax=Sulfuricurvum sp. TaxID=2025608 RepID=UPI0025DB2DA5|nr:methyl-accepting chemotaxis protein [Sulfuricurvum sp.]MCK9371893.1 methyl-accepting chemotaxis protein [Sulfuricurvum sp.]